MCIDISLLLFWKKNISLWNGTGGYVYMSHKIVFEPFGIVTNIEEQENILLAAQRLGLKLDAYCNGQQVCGKCKIRIAEGEFPGYGSIHDFYYGSKQYGIGKGVRKS